MSNFNASALEKLLARVEIKPSVNQCAFSIAGHTDSLWGRDDATKVRARVRPASVRPSVHRPLSTAAPPSQAFCDAHNITYSAYSPLGGWAKHGTGHVLNDPTVKGVAAAHNTTTAAIALRWVTQQGIVAVTSSDKASHIEGDLASFGVELSAEEVAKLAQVQYASGDEVVEAAR